MFSGTADFTGWFTERREARSYRVRRVPLDRLDGWLVEPDTRDLVHRSGKFFSVRGLDITGSGREVDSWQQPVIVQPEYGILGLLVKHFRGVPHYLLQAKMEPGNAGLVQLSPTVQATRSNYTRVHGGRPVPYLEHFVSPRGGRVVHDALQSGQASWFLGRRNRSVIVEAAADIPVLDDFCWVSADQLSELLAVDNLVNMDTRTLLSGALPHRFTGTHHDDDPFRDALARSWRRDVRSYQHTSELLCWFTEAKRRCAMTRRRIPLSEVSRWFESDGVVTHEAEKHFTVIGVDVQAGNREVTRWSQVMIEPRSAGMLAFLAKEIAGVTHLLVQARVGTGAPDLVEMAPSVQCRPGDYRSGGQRPLFLDYVLNAPRERIRFEALHSEEGGRFYHAQNRSMLIDVDDDFPVAVPENYTWMTVRQLVEFARYGGHLNVEARSLLTAVGFANLDSRVLQVA